MVIKVDLMQLEYTQAYDLINWCVANRIDFDRAMDLRLAWFATADTTKPSPLIWELEVPEEDLTYWMLKWD